MYGENQTVTSISGLESSQSSTNLHSLLQLDLIIDLLGTPTIDDMRSACEGAKSHIIRQPHRPPSLAALYTLSNQATHEAVHLLCRMLVFDPVCIKISFCIYRF